MFTNLIRAGASSPPAAALSEAPTAEPVAVSEPVAAAGPTIESLTNRAAYVAQDIAMAIPSVRKGVHVIAGTIGTFALHAVDANGTRLDSKGDRAWLAQPEARRTRQATLTRTVQDLIWHDRGVWRIVDRSAWGVATTFEWIAPSRISTVPNALDDSTVDTWIIDAREVRPADLVIFDGAGIGGLRRYGADLLTIYGQLQAAAGRYARAPQPYAILKNSGADLDDDEIDALLASWEAARETRGIGYTNGVVDYETDAGYSARELQLVEAREHAALEVARMLALPAFALDANQPGSSMTYGNVVDRRRDLLEALRPWMGVIEGTLSLDDRRGRSSGILLPRGQTVKFDADAYVRDDPKTRMATWQTALAAEVLTLDEVRAAEPMTRS